MDYGTGNLIFKISESGGGVIVGPVMCKNEQSGHNYLSDEDPSRDQATENVTITAKPKMEPLVNAG